MLNPKKRSNIMSNLEQQEESIVERIKKFKNTDFSDCPPLTAEQLATARPGRHRGKPVFIRPPKNSCISLWDTSNVLFLLQKDGTVVAIPRIPEEKTSSKVVEEVMV
jgi:hypothetical protein